jgi:cytochrome c-type biogenesis protein
MDTLVAAFGLGLASAASPCLLPLYPGFLAYLAANSRAIESRRGAGLLGLVVLAGVLSTMIVVGLVLTLLAIPTGRLLLVLVPAADLVLIVLGALLVADRNPFAALPGAHVPSVGNPYGQAYVYGMVLGPLALPCAGAFIVALLAISVGIVDAVGHLATFIAYGLGFGLPLVILSLVMAADRQSLVRSIVAHHRTIEWIAGIGLIAVGAVGLVGDWPNLSVGVAS